MNSNQKESYKVIPTKEFQRNLVKLDKTINRRILAAVENLACTPYTGKTLRGELKGLYSLRVGDYRIIYSVSTQRREVILHAVRHRSKAYTR